MTDMVSDVLNFNLKAGRPIPATPGDEPHWGSVSRAWMHVNEEMKELSASLDPVFGKGSPYRPGPDLLAPVADAGADLIWTTIGLMLSLGIDPRPVWAAVAAANKAKTDALDGPLRVTEKVPKPPGWVAPDIEAVLASQEPLTTEDRTP